MDRLREEIGALAESEEDVLTYAMFPDVARPFLEQRKEGTLTPEPLQPKPSEQAVSGIDTEFKVTVHGETYDIQITGERRFYMTVDGVPEEVSLESLAQFKRAEGGGKRAWASKEGHVTTTMPGNIVSVLVKEGDQVAAGDPVLVVEAMKMETEVKAPISGVVTGIFIQKGDRVTPSEVLVEIEPQ